MAAKKEKPAVQEVVERDGGAEELAAYMHLRATGRNDLGYHEPTRDQEPDVAPERGVMPGVDLFNPPPPEGVPLDIARPASMARIDVQRDSRDALPLEEKEELGPVEAFTPQDLAGADEDGNLPETDDSEAEAAREAAQADADAVVVNDGEGGVKKSGD